ncbi:hypothetical protein BX600DRAFT_531243 [Xylariales sp. PMI_506]|nr:hypothetical protein BX600DRAFT_531243 [Xylariales sp. PMI_506]
MRKKIIMECFESSDLLQSGLQDMSLQHAPKRIIICCDGTWQSSVSNITNIPSNITRLARYLTRSGRDKDGKEWQQLIYYDAGIGTGVSALEAMREGGTGSGFVGNVIEAYNFIVLNYHPGDQIFCLGFSRGAYTARAVAGLVTDIGVIQPRDMQDFPELYRQYQSHNNGHMFRKTKEWREWIEGKRLSNPNQQDLSAASNQPSLQWEKRPHAAAPESSRWIEAVGVFDTVGSLGIPKVVGWKGAIANPFLELVAKRWVPVEAAGFHNVGLSPYVKNAYHALALDEHRKPFSPTLWHLLEDHVANSKPKVSSTELKAALKKLHEDSKATEFQLNQAWQDLVDAEMREELKDHCPNLLQVWFPGVHINVGGGNDDLIKPEKRGDFEQIAMITLTWMAEQLKHHLSFEIKFADFAVGDRFALIRPDIVDLLKNMKDHWLTKEVHARLAKEPKADPWNDGNKTRSLVIASDVLKGWATGPIVDSFEGEMKEGGSLVRTPGNYVDRSPGQSRNYTLGATNEQIHPSVKYRMDQLGSKYKPAALKNFTREERKGSDGTVSYEWVKGSIRIPEYKIGPQMQESNAPSDYNKVDLFERYLVVDSAAQAFLENLDKGYHFDS